MAKRAGASRRTWLGRSLAVLALGPWGHGTAQEARFFRIATGPVGGSAYALGGLLAETVSSPPGTPPCEEGGSCGVPGLVALARSSAGSLANLELLAAGRVESAIVHADLAEAADRGEAEIVGGALAGRLRALAALLSAVVHLLVRADVPIAAVPDLAGKRVGFEEPGSGNGRLARRLLEAFGLDESRFEPVFLARTPMVEGIATGQLDALLLVGAWPLPAVEELVRDRGARLVPVTGPPVDALVRDVPYLDYQLVPFGAYPGQPAVETVGLPLLWLVEAELADELAHAIVASLWRPENRPRLRAGHPQGFELVPEQALQNLPVPLHPGAARWYREQGFTGDR
ncbi:MAG: C4-dicarboxylate ABC transporter substrate-binding protein [Geminicoccaceae bacterium]|nr:MAG: C4-dicarboxylate ABC transporter substrate-binding protein [Geminicoccaceae bacterium]